MCSSHFCASKSRCIGARRGGKTSLRVQREAQARGPPGGRVAGRPQTPAPLPWGSGQEALLGRAAWAQLNREPEPSETTSSLCRLRHSGDVFSCGGPLGDPPDALDKQGLPLLKTPPPSHPHHPGQTPAGTGSGCGPSERPFSLSGSHAPRAVRLSPLCVTHVWSMQSAASPEGDCSLPRHHSRQSSRRRHTRFARTRAPQRPFAAGASPMTATV